MEDLRVAPWANVTRPFFGGEGGVLRCWLFACACVNTFGFADVDAALEEFEVFNDVGLDETGLT